MMTITTTTTTSRPVDLDLYGEIKQISSDALRSDWLTEFSVVLLEAKVKQL